MSALLTYTSPGGVVYDVFEIPTQPQNQEFNVSLSGTTYFLRLKWNSPNQSWILDVLDSQQKSIVAGIPLITGTDLLDQLKYLDISGSLIVQSDYQPEQVPTYASLGSTGHLYYLSEAPAS